MRRSWLVIGVIAVVTIMVIGAFGSLLQSKEDDTLLVAISSDVHNWYNKEFADGDARFVWSQIYGTLVRLDTELNIIPGLADTWYTEDGGKTWQFNLTSGIKFHDGSDFNADAVIFSYNNDTFVKNYGVLKPVDHIERVDDLTVRFVMKEGMSMGSLPYYLTHIAWPIMSPNMADEDGKWNGKIIGTGPFKYESKRSNQEIVLARNDGYYGEAPDLKKIRFKVIPDPNSRKNALKAGDVDMILKVSENDVAELRGSRGIEVQTSQTTFTDFLQFNTLKAPFDNLDVRKAVAHAIDTELIVNRLLKGHGEAAGGRPISPIMMFADPDLEVYSKDLLRSNELMESAGWEKRSDGYYYKDGKRFSTTIIMVNEDAWAARFSEMSDAIKEMLKEAGMDIEVKKLPAGSFNDREERGDFGMILRTGYFVWGPYPRHFLLHDSMHMNSHYNNSDYDGLVRSADAAEGDEREMGYQELQQWVMDNLPAFYLVHEQKIVAYRDNVKGYTISAEDPWLNLEGVSVTR